MIGSTFSQMANAEKLSPQQLQQALKDGVIPSYIGIPLLQEKMKQAQAARAMAAGQQKPMPIAQQIMQQAQAEAGVEGLPSGLPVEGMAGGGIVAFAEGGMYDEEDDYEDRLDAERQAEIEDLMNQYAETFSGGIGQLPAAASVAPKQQEGIAGGDAADFVARIMHKESRGRRYDKAGNLLTSEKGAMGEMQVMPGTSRDPGFGVKPARDNSPDELARVGRDYAQTLLSRYGDPKLAAIAYNMGPGATDKWLAAGADVSKLPRETQGYVKGFADGGDVEEDKYAGVWPYNAPEAGKFTYGDTLDKEAKKALAFSAAPLAAAGDVLLSPITGLRKMVRNPLDKSESPSWTPLYDARNRYLYGDEGKETKPAVEDKGLPSLVRGRPTMANDPRLIGAKPPAAAPMPKVSPYDTEDMEAGLGAAAAAAAAKGLQAAPSAEKVDPYQEFRDLFKRREENLAKQREQDKYMALLQAGLGMMGGTSPNAFANIGAGATQGLQSLAEARKAATAEENALLSGRLGLAKIGTAKEQADAMMQMRRDIANQTNERLRQAGEAAADAKAASLTERTHRDLANQLGQMEKLATTKMLAKMKNQIVPGQESVIEAQALEALMADPGYRALYKKVHGFDPMGGTMPTGGGSHPKPIQSILDKYSKQ